MLTNINITNINRLPTLNYLWLLLLLLLLLDLYDRRRHYSEVSVRRKCLPCRVLENRAAAA